MCKDRTENANTKLESVQYVACLQRIRNDFNVKRIFLSIDYTPRERIVCDTGRNALSAVNSDGLQYTAFSLMREYAKKAAVYLCRFLLLQCVDNDNMRLYIAVGKLVIPVVHALQRRLQNKTTEKRLYRHCSISRKTS